MLWIVNDTGLCLLTHHVLIVYLLTAWPRKDDSLLWLCLAHILHQIVMTTSCPQLFSVLYWGIPPAGQCCKLKGWTATWSTRLCHVLFDHQWCIHELSGKEVALFGCGLVAWFQIFVQSCQHLSLWFTSWASYNHRILVEYEIDDQWINREAYSDTCQGNYTVYSLSFHLGRS